MFTLHFIMISTVDGEEIQTNHISVYPDPYMAEDVMHSMQSGVYDDDYVRYVPNKIVYELEGAD